MDGGNEGHEGHKREVTVSPPAAAPEPSPERFAYPPSADWSYPSPGSRLAPLRSEWVATEPSTAEPHVALIPQSPALGLSPQRGRLGRWSLIPTALAVTAALSAVGLAGGRRHSPSSSPAFVSAGTSTTRSAHAPDGTGEIARLLAPAVVDVNTINQTDTGYALSAATGMIVSSDGYVVTNNHVVAEATSIKVSIDGLAKAYRAHFVGADPAADVAVIRVDGLRGLRAVHFGNSAKVALGEYVVAMGNALGRGGAPAVTAGSVSAIDRSISAGDVLTSSPEQLDGLIETSAAVAPGDSGGPLVNEYGQVIGMVTATEANRGNGFALPIDRVAAIVNAIEAGRSGRGVLLGLRAFLGVVGQLPRAGVTAGGVRVTRIVLGDPASRAGIEPGDTIVAFDNKPTMTVSVLEALVRAERPGEPATVTFEMPSGVHTAKVRLVDGPAP